MEVSEIIYVVTAIVTLILGFVAKKQEWFNNNLIPLQNLSIGIISAIVYYIITKDINLVLTAIPLTMGGTYDIVNNLLKLKKGK